MPSGSGERDQLQACTMRGEPVTGPKVPSVRGNLTYWPRRITRPRYTDSRALTVKKHQPLVKVSLCDIL